MATIFSVSNHHCNECGNAPLINGDNQNLKTSYFEGLSGDQFIFVYDRVAKTAVIYGGDLGWDKSYIVENGVAPELVLADDEKLWVMACWIAATGQSMTSIFNKYFS